VNGSTRYRNTIPPERQGPYPGDLAIEERLTSVMRWNALVMVVRANQAYNGARGISSGAECRNAKLER